MQLYEYLRDLRSKDSRTNQEIAQKTGISISNFSRIFSGENDNPSWLTLVPLFKELKGSMDTAAGIRQEEAENLSSLVGAQKQRIEDQREIIDNQQRTFDFRVQDYEKRLAEQKEVLAARQGILERQNADLRETYEKRMDIQKDFYEARLQEHKSQLQRERDRSDSLQKEIGRIRKIDTVMTIALSVLATVAIYIVLDALNGGWGMIRY